MLPAKQHNDFVAEFKKTIDLLGTRFTLTKAKDGSTVTLNAHFVDMTANDVPLVNSIGIESRLARTHATPKIEKYDTLTAPSGTVYTVYVSHEVYINDVQVGQRLVIKE